MGLLKFKSSYFPIREFERYARLREQRSQRIVKGILDWFEIIDLVGGRCGEGSFAFLGARQALHGKRQVFAHIFWKAGLDRYIQVWNDRVDFIDHHDPVHHVGQIGADRGGSAGITGCGKGSAKIADARDIQGPDDRV